MLEKLLDSLSSPPIFDEDWIAGLPRGRIAIEIEADGTWLYQGEAFKRHSMVVLLAQHLYLQNDIHYLVAPEQLLRIEVYDCPFIATALSLERSSAGVQRVEWGTNLGHRGRLGERNGQRGAL